MPRYPDNTPISKELFEQCGWQAALENGIHDDYSSMWQQFSKVALVASRVHSLSFWFALGKRYQPQC